jgi:hypothetical protein
VAETTVKILLCCEFRRTGKVMGQVYQCWWRICREINVFFRFEYCMFYVVYTFVTYLLTASHTTDMGKQNIPSPVTFPHMRMPLLDNEVMIITSSHDNTSL